MKFIQQIDRIWVKIKESVLYEYVEKTTRRVFERHNLTSNASSISFFILLSIIPLFFITVTILSYFLGSADTAESYINHFISQNFPEVSQTFISELLIKSEITGNMATVIENRGTFGFISLLSLLWAAGGAFVAIEDALNKIFRERSRNFAVSRLIIIGVVFMMALLFITSNLIGSLTLTLQTRDVVFVGYDFGQLPYFWKILNQTLPIVVTATLFFMIYKILPRRSITSRAAWVGAITATILWELTMAGFRIYLTTFKTYSILYGSLTGIVVTMIVVYLSALILLIGAEVTELTQARIAHRKTVIQKMRELGL